MRATLDIRLLGAFSLAYGGEPTAAPRGARPQSLLAYLILHSAAPVSRQQLAFGFWPDTNDAQAQTNLRQLLHTLRRRLPRADDYLEVTPTTVQWRPDAPYALDVADFLSALDRARLLTGSTQAQALSEAVNLYTGDLLPDCYEDWILPERERLLQCYLVALEQLIAVCTAQRDYPAAISYAQRLLRHDPLHEPAYHYLVQLHAATGDRAAALLVYHTCATVLARELGIDPSPAMRQLYEQLLEGGERSEAQPEPAVRGKTPLIGRRDEWQSIQHAWHRAQQGAPTLACISGEAGIGKTRLIEEMVRWAQQQGIQAIQMRAYGAEGELAYAPLAEVLRSDQLAQQLARLDPSWIGELARIQPDLLRLAPVTTQAEASPPLPVAQEGADGLNRRRLFEALARAFVGERRPLLLVIDDLHWCDGETLEWLHYLLRYDAQAPLLVLVAVRPEAVEPDSAVAHALLSLRTGPALHIEIALSRLSRQETDTLAEAVVQSLQTQPAREPAAVEHIYEATLGNPLFIVETVRLGLAAPGSSAARSGPGLDSGDLPPKVHAVLRTRLEQPSAHARALVGLAAVIGRSFSFDVLAAAWDQGENTLVHCLDELWQRHLLRVHGPTAYDFDHDRLRDVAYAELGPAQRRYWHARIAQALARVHVGDIDAVSAQMAHHYEQAGEIAQAIVHLQHAAEVALHRLAYRDAIALLEHGIALLPHLPQSQVVLQFELELRMALGRAWVGISNYLGDANESAAAYERALALCREVRHSVHLYTALWGLHAVALYRIDFAQSIALAEQCLVLAQELEDVGLIVEAHHALWGPYHFRGDFDAAMHHVEQGLRLYDRTQHEPLSLDFGMHDAAACGLEIKAFVLWQRGQLAQMRQVIQQLANHKAQLELPPNVADACAYLALLFYLLREPAAAHGCAAAALQIGREHEYDTNIYFSELVLGWSTASKGDIDQGDIDQGVAGVREGFAKVQSAGQRLHYSQLAAIAAEVYLLANQPQAALVILDEAIDRFAAERDLLCAPDLWRLKGDALRLLGRLEQVEACYRQAVALAQELQAKTSELRAAVALARLLHAQGYSSLAGDLLRPIYSSFSEGFDCIDLREAGALLEELSN